MRRGTIIMINTLIARRRKLEFNSCGSSEIFEVNLNFSHWNFSVQRARLDKFSILKCYGISWKKNSIRLKRDLSPSVISRRKKKKRRNNFQIKLSVGSRKRNDRLVVCQIARSNWPQMKRQMKGRVGRNWWHKLPRTKSHPGNFLPEKVGRIQAAKPPVSPVLSRLHQSLLLDFSRCELQTVNS